MSQGTTSPEKARCGACPECPTCPDWKYLSFWEKYGQLVKRYVGVIALVGVLTFVSFCLGQDNPKPGTAMTAETYNLLKEAEYLKLDYEFQKTELEAARSSNKYLESELAEYQGAYEDTSPVQTFISGPDYNPEYTENEVTPFGLEMTVRSRWLELPAVMPLDMEEEPWLDARVSLAGGKEIKLPTDYTWVRLNKLILVRISPDNETKSLGYSYPRDAEGNTLDYPVLTYTYRAIEAKIEPDVNFEP